MKIKRKALEKAHNSREYLLIMKNSIVYCQICTKISGNWKSACQPKSNHKFRNWKRYRKTQWK